MVAIPVFRTRVAPVLDWCSKIKIISEEGPDGAASREINVKEDSRFEVMRTLRRQGIDIVICGALSPKMLNYCENIGLRIIHGIAGDIGEVFQAYCSGELDRPRYWLPGCGGQGRYREGAKCMDKPAGAEQGGGPGGLCVCPECGSTLLHERGLPCSQIRCAKCSAPMTRRMG